MKKFFAASLAILLCLTMFSCGKAGNNQSVITNDGTEFVNARELGRITPAFLPQYETEAEKTTDSENGQQSNSVEAPKTKEAERLDFYSGLLAKNGDYYKSIVVEPWFHGFGSELNDKQLRVSAAFSDSLYDYIKKASIKTDKELQLELAHEWENEHATWISESNYKIISSVDELPEFSWEIEKVFGKVEKVVGNKNGIDASLFEDNVIIFTTRMYDKLRTPAGFKNLAFRDGKMVIVAELDDWITDGKGSTVFECYVDFIIVPKSEIPEGTAKEGRIEILDRNLRSATNKDGDSENDNNNPSQSSGIKREPLSEEQQFEMLKFYSEVLAKNGDYYKSITVSLAGSEVEFNDNQLIVKAAAGNSLYKYIEKNQEYSMISDERLFFKFLSEYATIADASNYKIISSVDELPEFLLEIREISGNVEKIVGNEKGIDASLFEDNVIIFTTRMYGLLRTPVGFKNLAFRDGKMVIVADLDDNEMDGCTLMDYYLDFIIVPKSEIPEGTAKEGRIEILNKHLRGSMWD